MLNDKHLSLECFRLAVDYLSKIATENSQSAATLIYLLKDKNLSHYHDHIADALGKIVVGNQLAIFALRISAKQKIRFTNNPYEFHNVWQHQTHIPTPTLTFFQAFAKGILLKSGEYYL
jgi:predicted cupin superfamily sugar epimerase